MAYPVGLMRYIFFIYIIHFASVYNVYCIRKMNIGNTKNRWKTGGGVKPRDKIGWRIVQSSAVLWIFTRYRPRRVFRWWRLLTVQYNIGEEKRTHMFVYYYNILKSILVPTNFVFSTFNIYIYYCGVSATVIYWNRPTNALKRLLKNM